MTTSAMLAIFEDFNDKGDEPLPAVAEELSGPEGQLGQIREEAWTDGYVTGRRDSSALGGDQVLAASLLTSVHELDLRASDVVDAAALQLADLLVSTVIAVTSEEWSARLLDRVRIVAQQIKPALTVAPEFVLHATDGSEHRFGDIAELSRALDEGDTNQDVSIRWQRGEATISHKALLEDLRDAIIPLSAGLTFGLNNQSITRQQT
jgi:hypothetical protein